MWPQTLIVDLLQDPTIYNEVASLCASRWHITQDLVGAAWSSSCFIFPANSERMPSSSANEAPDLLKVALCRWKCVIPGWDSCWETQVTGSIGVSRGSKLEQLEEQQWKRTFQEVFFPASASKRWHAWLAKRSCRLVEINQPTSGGCWSQDH